MSVCPQRPVDLVAEPIPSDQRPLLPLVGADLSVPVLGGDQVRYVNLDVAASAPALVPVWEAVQELMPWYSSVHRGAGFASQVCTRILESARDEVAAFVGAPEGSSVIFTRNTTDSVHLLSAALPQGTEVITFAAQHHANLLPWSRHDPTVVPVLDDSWSTLAAAEEALCCRQPGRSGERLLAITGASNVTGEIWPLAEMVQLAHTYGARVLIDAAQLAPHRAIDLSALGADYLVFSGHKLYAPFGTGVLIGASDWLDDAPPYLAGGGATRHVTEETVEWHRGPARHEGGTPNLVGITALAAGCRALSDVGMERVHSHEAALLSRLEEGLGRLPQARIYRLWPDADRVGVVSFDIDGYAPDEVATILSAEHGIAVRHGRFCAHPLVDHLTGAANHGGGAVRVSLGVGTCAEDVDRLIEALEGLALADRRSQVKPGRR